MVNTVRTYNPTAYTDAYDEAVNLLESSHSHTDDINKTKMKYYKTKTNFDGKNINYAFSRSSLPHCEFDLMNIEKVIHPEVEYDVIRFGKQDYKYKKEINENQFTQSLFHAVHVSKHCQIIPSTFQSLNTCIRDVFKEWTLGDIDPTKPQFIGEKYNVIDYNGSTYDFKKLSDETKALLDKEMRMISLTIYNAFLRPNDATGFSAMVPKHVLDIVMDELRYQTPNEIGVGQFIKDMFNAHFPVKVVDTYEFDIPCTKENPIIRYVSNHNFHPLWTYPVDPMISAVKKKVYSYIYLSCEEKTAYKKAAELGVIEFHPLLKNLLVPAKREKRASFTGRHNLTIKNFVFKDDVLLTEKSSEEIVDAYMNAPYSLDPESFQNEGSRRFPSEDSKSNYGAVKSEYIENLILRYMTPEELAEHDAQHQRKHEESIRLANQPKRKAKKSTRNSGHSTPEKRSSSGKQPRFSKDLFYDPTTNMVWEKQSVYAVLKGNLDIKPADASSIEPERLLPSANSDNMGNSDKSDNSQFLQFSSDGSDSLVEAQKNNPSLAFNELGFELADLMLLPLNSGDENNFNITQNQTKSMDVAEEKDSFALITSEEDAAPIIPLQKTKRVNKPRKTDKVERNSPLELIKQMERHSVIPKEKIVDSNNFAEEFDCTLNDDDAFFCSQFMEFNSDINYKTELDETNVSDGVNDFVVPSPPDLVDFLNNDVELTFNVEDFLTFDVPDEA